MRVAETIKDETYIVCPECKKLLAYTADDIRPLIKFSNDLFKVSSYIDCPMCGYSSLINYKEYKQPEGSIAHETPSSSNPLHSYYKPPFKEKDGKIFYEK